MQVATRPASSGEQDHYAVLQLQPSAEIGIVEQAYWHLAYKYNAAAARGDPAAAAGLRRLNDAMSAIGSEALSEGVLRPSVVPEELEPTGENFLGVLGKIAFEAWWYLVVIATLALGVGLVDHWAGIRGVSEHLADWRRELITWSSVALGLLIGLPLLLLIIKSLPKREARLDPNKDYYQVLHIRPQADSEIVKIAYQQLHKKYETLNGYGGDQKRLAELDQAFSLLSDSERRAEYDGSRLARLSGTSVEVLTPPPSMVAGGVETIEAGATAAPEPLAGEQKIPAPTPPLEDRPPSAPESPDWQANGAATVDMPPSSSLASLEGKTSVEPPSTLVAGPKRTSIVISALKLAARHAGRLLRLLGTLLLLLATYLWRFLAAATRLGRQKAQEHLFNRPQTSPEEEEAQALLREAQSKRKMERLSTYSTGNRRTLEAETEVELVADPEADSTPVALLTVGTESEVIRTLTLGPRTAVTIGRDPSCDIVLSDEEGRIAPHQARIWPREDKFMFHLLSSELPATVQGKPFVWVVLEDGDLIEVGPYRIRFRLMNEQAV